MDQQRIFFLIALAIITYFLAGAWSDFKAGPEVATNNAAVTASVNSSDGFVPDSADASPPAATEVNPADNSLATVASAEPSTVANSNADGSVGNSSAGFVPGGQDQPAPVKASQGQQAGTIKVVTDLADIQIDLAGGGISDFQLRQARYEQKVLLSDGMETPLFAELQATVFTAQKGAKPNWQVNYSSPQTEYRMQVIENEDGEVTGKSPLVVPITTSVNGVTIVREYVFTPGEYLIQLNTRVNNQSNAAWSGYIGSRLVRNGYAEDGNVPFMTSFLGFASSARDPDEKNDPQAENEYDDYDFGQLEDDRVDNKENVTKAQGGWAGIAQRYYLAAVLPSKNDLNTYEFRSPESNRYMATVWSPKAVVAAGATAEFSNKLYVGPKIQDRLDDYAENLTDTVDYGILTLLSQPLFWLMNFLHNLIGVWGLVIILITLIVKAAFYKLTEAQYRSMAKMRKFAPRIKSIKERYSDDRQKQQQETMKLFKKEKINPVGGCLPILLQMPVFMAFYWVLLESVELKGATFLWLPDLTEADPYFILPVIFGISMFVQQRLTASTATMDPMQAKIMSLLPVFLTVMFSFFPSGLVLYWCVNNILGIAQQWYINRKLDAETARMAKN